MVACDDEMRQELTWASTRKGSNRITPLALTDHDCFVQALLPWEFANFITVQRHKSGVVYTLSQNAYVRECWSSDDVLHTVIANKHMFILRRSPALADGERDIIASWLPSIQTTF